MTGTEKLKPLVIGKSAKPRCFKNVVHFPVHYRANTRSWMTSKLFHDWLLELDKMMISQKRKILLFIDNCPAHNDTSNLQNITVEFFPPNTTSKLQPLDAGIICNFKVHYRSLVVKKLIQNIDSEESSGLKITVLDAMRMADRAWRNVTSTTIRNCFHKCGFQTSDTSTTNEDSVDVAIDTSLWRKMDLDKTVSFDDYIHVDDDVSTAGSLTDAEIMANAVKDDKAACDESSEEEDAQDKWRPSTKDALKAVDTLRAYFQHAKDHGEEVYGGLHAIENALEEQFFKGLSQSKITNFFTVRRN